MTGPQASYVDFVGKNIAVQTGLRLSEVPIIEHRRLAGRSKVSALYHGALILGVIVRERLRSDASSRAGALD